MKDTSNRKILREPDISFEEILRITKQHTLTVIQPPKEAAVLIPLLRASGEGQRQQIPGENQTMQVSGEGQARLVSRERQAMQISEEAELLFEVRASGLSQGGDICFPGGGLEKGEDAAAAAIRETEEELLLTPEQVRILAPLHRTRGPRGLSVTSFLGELTSYQGSFSPSEIQEVFTLPLQFFLENEPLIYQTEQVTRVREDFPYEQYPEIRSYHWQPAPRTLYFYRTEKGVIWGLTAELLYHFVQLLKA